MNTVTWLHPAPYSPLPFNHPARAYTKSENTDVRRTIAEHQVGDDCDAMERSAHLDLPGEFA